jgi:hypothetical protein
MAAAGWEQMDMLNVQAVSLQWQSGYGNQLKLLTSA